MVSMVWYWMTLDGTGWYGFDTQEMFSAFDKWVPLDGMILILGTHRDGMVLDGMVLILGRCRVRFTNGCHCNGMILFLGRRSDGMVLILGKC